MLLEGGGERHSGRFCQAGGCNKATTENWLSCLQREDPWQPWGAVVSPEHRVQESRDRGRGTDRVHGRAFRGV